MYTCEICDMKIEDLICGHCEADLEHKTIKSKEGNDVQVCECPAKCGKVKSPMCCGQDMTHSKEGG